MVVVAVVVMVAAALAVPSICNGASGLQPKAFQQQAAGCSCNAAVPCQLLVGLVLVGLLILTQLRPGPW